MTKWLLEISAGVFVGQVSARMRDMLWDGVCEACSGGRAVLVYSSNNEQRLDFRICGETWEPIDFDGIKLILRPSAARLNSTAKMDSARHVSSDAAKQRIAKKLSAGRIHYPDSYIVMDLETTGLNPDTDEIIEIGAVKIKKGEVSDTFHSLVVTDKPISQDITAINGITDEMVKANGKPMHSTIREFIVFIENMPIVAHNLDFDRSFLQNACIRNGLDVTLNRCVDTLSLARRLVKGLPSYKLETLARHFNIEPGEVHRSLGDCETTRLLYEKLLKLMEAKL